MHFVTKNIRITLVLTTLLLVSGGLPAQTPPAELAAKYEPLITGGVEKGQWRDAVRAAAEYEEGVRACYPGTAFAKSLVQSETEHVSFTCPFDDWTRTTPKDLKIPTWLPAAGLNCVLTLTEKKTDDRFFMMAMDASGKNILTGVADAPVTEKDLTLCAFLLGQYIGEQKESGFEQIGDRKVLEVELAAAEGKVVQMLITSNAGKVYAFGANSSQSESGGMKGKLREMLKSLDCQYKLSDAGKVEAARAKVTDPDNVKQCLACVRELTQIGAYSEAGNDLKKLRKSLVRRIPKPVITNGEIRYEAYGITIKNPDPAVWKSDVHEEGALTMMMLENRSSVDSNGILVMVTEPMLVYGAHVDEAVGSGATEEDVKSIISSSGRGGLLNVAEAIDSERYRTFKGNLAYEGIAKANLHNVTAKVIVVMNPKYVLMILLMVNAQAPVHQFTAYESILDKNLTVK